MEEQFHLVWPLVVFALPDVPERLDIMLFGQLVYVLVASACGGAGRRVVKPCRS